MQVAQIHLAEDRGQVALIDLAADISDKAGQIRLEADRDQVGHYMRLAADRGRVG